MKKRRAIIGLADGSYLTGYAYGSHVIGKGELVFNTSMSGYQEIITDPSYGGQIITFTYPHIGNVGINAEDYESKPVRTAGVVLRDISPVYSNYRAEHSLEEFLEKYKCPAITSLDTRMLTRKLRDSGCQNSCIISFTGGTEAEKEAATEAIKLAQEMPSISSSNLAAISSISKEQKWQQGTHPDFSSFAPTNSKQVKVKTKSSPRVVVYDCGLKHNIARMITEKGAKVELLPYSSDANKILASKPDGIVISNGPGDPNSCTKVIEDIKSFIAAGIPMLGICLGQQLIGLASGAKIIKLKFGHHGANHPVRRLKDNSVAITSQNHNYSLDDESLPSSIEVTHRSLFDDTIQGIKLKNKPVIAFQGHPEASPGPHDIADVFTDFVLLIRDAQSK